MSIPKLTSLNINLSEEEQVDYIMKTLPGVQFLNGLEVERDDDEEEEEESENDEESKEPQSNTKTQDIEEEKEEIEEIVKDSQRKFRYIFYKIS